MEPNYKAMSREELKNACKQAGLHNYHTNSKLGLIQLLEQTRNKTFKPETDPSKPPKTADETTDRLMALFHEAIGKAVDKRIDVLMARLNGDYSQ